MIKNTGPFVINLLCEHMDFVPRGQLLDQRNRIALSAAARRGKRAVENGDAQLRRHSTQGRTSARLRQAHFLRQSS